ncbi:hypothetical protein LILAB_18575 [Corallococcus macrosporus]|nr:hypothetical protein LILAB_18575 [Corallococcus macrosporus]
MLAGCSVLSSTVNPQRRIGYSSHAQNDDKNEAIAFSTPADLRLAFLREKGVDAIYCAEPMPDVSLSSEAAASGSMSAAAALAQSASAATNAALAEENEALRKDLREAIRSYEQSTKSTYNRTLSSDLSSATTTSSSLNLQAAYKLAVTAAELGGRSQAVLVAREYLYRLCEARANKFDDEAYARLQERALAMVEAITKPAPTNPAADRAALAQRISELATTQMKLCDTQKSACMALVGDDKDKAKTTACGEAFKKCVDAIQPMKFAD